MNAEQLLQHFERISEAPDAIKRLRRFILDLAVRGKLVEQDPSEEPAAELLKRIAAENLEVEDLPQGWRKAKIGSVLNFQYGKGLKASERLDKGPVPVFGSNGIVGYTDDPLTVCPSIIIGRKGSAGALNICDGPSWTTDVAYFVEAPSFLTLRFLLNVLASIDLDKLGKGVKPGLSRSEAYEQIIPLPPLPEQHRIVAKVDELMNLCDQLDAAKVAREKCRDSLVAGSLQVLNQPAEEEETFREHARFTFNNLPRITTRVAHIKQLRQTILNLAVRGKLVEQDPSEEPAAELLKRIAAENLEVEDLPQGWRKAKIGSVLNFQYGKGLKASERLDKGPVPVFGSNGIVGYTDDPLTVCPSIIIGRKGSAGALNICDGPSWTTDVAYFVEAPSFLTLRFLLNVLASIDLDKLGKGVKPGLSRSEAYEQIIPLPPLPEQHRIVAKVDELMNLCDQLEAQITVTEQDSRRFLESILAQALAPVIDLSAEAKVA